jgi:hypothetical protein
MPTPLAQTVDRLVAALEHRLDAAIGSISDPAGHACSSGFAATGFAKEDSLDIATYNETTSDHASAV